MADAYFRTDYIDVPGPDGVTLNAKGPDLHGTALNWLFIDGTFFIGPREKCIIRAFGTDVELKNFKLTPHVIQVPESAVVAQLRAHIGRDYRGKVDKLWKAKD